MVKPRLFLIDATAFCYRAFYAIHGLATTSGEPTNAVYGFLRILQKILKEHKPQLLGVCFDVSRKTFRHAKDAEYKSNRPEMPHDLISQIPVIKEIIRAYGIPIFEAEGFEADDVIATLAEEAKNHGVATTIISSDKDLLQLVDENVLVLNPQKDEETIFDVSRVEEKFGLKPAQIVELVAFIGDAADNIPAIKGVSEKKAVELIREFGSVEGIINNLDKISPEKVRLAIEGSIERVRLNRELADLDKKMGLKFDPVKLTPQEPDYQELFKLFKRLEFKALLKDLPVADQSEEISVQEITGAEFAKSADKAGEMFLDGRDPESLIFSFDHKFLKVDKLSSQVISALVDPKIKKTGHDLKTIKLFLNKADIALDGLFFDTMIAAYLVNPSKSSYSLEDVAWDYLGKSLKAETLDCAQRLALIKELKSKLEDELKDKSLIDLFTRIEMPLVEVLAGMEAEGIKIDLKLLKELSKDLETRLAKLIEEIHGLCGCQFNINSPKQLREVLFEKLKLRVIKRTKSGPSTDEEVLNKLAEEHELPKKLLEYRKLTKLKSTYIDALPEMVDEKTGRIHTSFNQTGTETGRLSSSNPNLQNVPTKTDLGRRIREAIISFSKDSSLLSCDYSQIELRILAHICKDKALIQAFQENKDIHRRTAAQIYGIEESQVSDAMRNSAKAINFGIVYGLSSFGLSRDLHIRVEEAQGFIDSYFATYPGVKVFIDEQIARAEKDGFVTTISGRRRYLPDINNKNQSIRQFAQRQAVNTPIQGSASDLIKMAMVEIHRQIRDKKEEGVLIL
ncbi:MAG: DNA polymerase I, partial [Candidatus Omnitrophica bacterium]|nr:DNA polymerase I [Candidatus Omnitrophota bacterium]